MQNSQQWRDPIETLLSTTLRQTKVGRKRKRENNDINSISSINSQTPLPPVLISSMGFFPRPYLPKQTLTFSSHSRTIRESTRQVLTLPHRHSHQQQPVQPHTPRLISHSISHNCISDRNLDHCDRLRLTTMVLDPRVSSRLRKHKSIRRRFRDNPQAENVIDQRISASSMFKAYQLAFWKHQRPQKNHHLRQPCGLHQRTVHRTVLICPWS